MTPQQAQQVQQQWAQHWPFTRASEELIRQAQQAERQRQPSAPF